MQKTNKTVLYITIITLMSRFLSLVGYQFYMSFYGPQNVYLNIYSYALSIPNIIFNCVGTCLTTIIIPIYSSLVTKKEYKKSNEFLNDIINISCTFIIFLIVIFWFLSPYIANITSYKSYNSSFKFMIFALRILLPSMFFYCLNYIFQGIHHCNGSFIIPSLATVPSSIVLIIYVIFLGDICGIEGLLIVTVFGFFLQVIILVPKIIKIGYKYKISFNLKNENIVDAVKLMIPVLVSVLSYQINMFFSFTLATKFNTVTIMTYVQNLILVSILSIIYSITGVYFPKLTHMWSLNKKSDFGQTLKNIINFILFLFLPATGGLILLRFDIINLLAKWGDFSRDSSIMASNMLGMYGLGIIALGIKEILDKAFYSQKDAKTPAIFGFIIMISNIFLSLVFIKYLGTYSMPLSYSISNFIGVFFIMVIMNRRVRFIDKDFFIIAIKSLFATLIMCIIVNLEIIMIKNLYIVDEIITRLFKLFIPSITGVIIYLVLGYFLKISQLQVIYKRYR